MEQMIVYFALYGGMDDSIELDLFDEIELSAEIHFVQNFSITEKLISPPYLISNPYRDILIAVARGDARLSNIFKRARVGDELGRRIIGDLVELDLLTIESSRQAPLRTNPKQLLPKHLRGYKIEPKIRFRLPFYRFWFGFVEPYRSDLSKGVGSKFTQNFNEHKGRAYSLLFEQLSNLLLEHYFTTKDPLISQGSFWDHNSEFDIFCITQSGKVILGECKYTSRPVTRKELIKLKDKAKQSGIKPDKYALFSKSGFSNELTTLSNDSLLLFNLDVFKALVLDF